MNYIGMLLIVKNNPNSSLIYFLEIRKIFFGLRFHFQASNFDQHLQFLPRSFSYLDLRPFSDLKFFTLFSHLQFLTQNFSCQFSKLKQVFLLTLQVD